MSPHFQAWPKPASHIRASRLPALVASHWYPYRCVTRRRSSAVFWRVVALRQGMDFDSFCASLYVFHFVFGFIFPFASAGCK
jgi:hypothetical protein